MRVLIVAKTRMSNSACIGGLLIEDNRSARLLQPDGSNYPKNTEFDIGQLWNIEFAPRLGVVPPHVEDILVESKTFLKNETRLRDFISGRIRPWSGSPDNLFNKSIRATAGGRGYISESTGLPICSTGFWIPDQTLVRFYNGRKVGYRYPGVSGVREMTYVGFTDPIERIPSGTLVRVSLARWWRPADADDAFELRCYLQLSGWYS